MSQHLLDPQPQAVPDLLAVREALTPAEERFERGRRTLGLFAGPALCLALLLWSPSSLSPEAHRLFAISGLVLTYWVTEALPLPVTALLGVVLCAALGVAPPAEALAPFADPIIFLFIGSFILAEAMAASGLDRRIALRILALRWVGDDAYRILLAYGGVTMLLSMWVSNTATTAMMLPIGLGVLRTAIEAMRAQAPVGQAAPPVIGDRRFRYGTGMMLMAAYASSIGGIGTPVGSPPNLIGIGMIRRLAGREITFFQWMALSIPMMLAMYAVLFLLMVGLHPPGARRLAGVRAYVREQRARLGPWTPAQRNTLAAFLVAVALWLLPGVVALLAGADSQTFKLYSARLHEGIVALLAAVLLFALPTDWPRRRFTLTWERAASIDWGTILLFGGGLTLGKLMFSTKLAEAIGGRLMALTGAETLWGITAFAVAFGIVASETTSNTASANMTIPVVIAMAQSAGVSGIPPALGACLGSSFGFMLPVSTPPNAIVYGSGLVPITSMIRAGALFDLCGFALIWSGLRVLCPALGLV